LPAFRKSVGDYAIRNLVSFPVFFAPGAHTSIEMQHLPANPLRDTIRLPDHECANL
jgi:hypothetical protein